jgi:uncharacterized protein YecT (DUF1311 family)
MRCARLTAVGMAFISTLGILSVSGARAQSQSEIDAAAQQALRSVETQLKSAVATYRRRLGAPQRKAFDESQRLWVDYRKAACAFQSSGIAGGSARPMVEASCLRDYAVARLKILHYLLNCQEGDLSCPAFKHGT